MKAVVMRTVSSVLTSQTLRDLRRRMHRRSGTPMIDYFHQVDDPYSHLAAQTLGRLTSRYGVAIRPWLVPPPEDSAAPERQRLADLARRDAAVLAGGYGLDFPTGAKAPSPAAVAAANDALAGALGAPDFASQAIEVGDALWRGAPLRSSGDGAAALAAGKAEREKLGHYLGAMLHYEGEWYWGVDRINHLERRLRERGFDTAPEGTPDIAPYRPAVLGARPANGQPAVVEIWFSFRSPYSWIAFPRARAIARHYGAELKMRYILPMVMRGLPVPRIKSRYIMFDTKREADLAGLPFGKVVDPVGPGAERSLAVVHYAAPLGLGEDFAESAMRGAWAEGIDLASDEGMYTVAERAGLTREQVDAALADESWRATAEANRQALFDAGLWGAPSYRVNGGPAHWGQDRLWALENDLIAAMQAKVA